MGPNANRTRLYTCTTYHRLFVPNVQPQASKNRYLWNPVEQDGVGVSFVLFNTFQD